MPETDLSRNRLDGENSLYLRQHAGNPVHWQPWGPEAFEEARRRDVPVIVSVGYSSCHWCHVMERESFEDPYIADLMNRHFVCIKVDREERPDVDQIYMEAVQMINQHGGWPLNAFCLPDGRPFFGGTYFPPEDRGQGIVPWPQLIMRIADYFKKNRDELEENAGNIVKNLAAANVPMGADGTSLANEALVTAAEAICGQHDDEWGGFGDAPKFPPSMTLDFLLAMRATQAVSDQPELASQLDDVIRKSLAGMARGGIFDQIGGGFCRYSTDRHWIIPHFEKMLYDNGLLLDIFSKGWQRYRQPLYADVVTETIGWLEREMLAPEGAFYASLDADSEGVEGKYYVWTPDEIEAVLGKDEAAVFCDAYLITPKGNFEQSGASNPCFAGGETELRTRLAPAREKLLAVRQQRVAPTRDPKILLAWNALAIRGLATAAVAFGKKEWFARARDAADFLWEKMRTPEGRLYSVYYPQAGPRVNATLEDYAYFMEALLALGAWADWHEPGTSRRTLDRAAALMETVFKHFRDPGQAGFFFSPDDGEELVARKKTWFDNAIPSANSSLLHALSALHMLNGTGEYAAEMNDMRQAYPGLVARAPAAVAHALSAYAQSASGLAVIKVKGTDDLEPLRAALAERPWRRVFVQLSDDPAQPEGYQLCVGTTCSAPTADPAEVAQYL
ncbi:thioredoxin domain-containing protein [Ruficoccus amylovorans]|uniref:Thioredoxin domain-containing protein n=1 Tax=Ruficoccus amylovorans TaxID=1804625 RepID=A0A842HD22_9BACT|nr:thioredoxin domain-containing protein [Ruficoccus amylovorans]MBC2593444.1 thioredoxin domain-containing protein [Ruficoccus amylovorans]